MKMNQTPLLLALMGTMMMTTTTMAAAFSAPRTSSIRTGSSVTHFRPSWTVSTMTPSIMTFASSAAHTPSSTFTTTRQYMSSNNDGNNNNNNNDFAAEDFASFEDEYTGSVDWDAEWKKVVKNQGQPSNRPKDIGKSDAEIAVTKVVNKAAQNVVDVTSSVQVPQFDSLKGDWKFWIGVLAVISVGTSLLAASGGGGVPSSSYPDGSYYI